MCGCGRNEGAGGGGGGFIPGMLTVRQRGLVGPSGGAAGEKVKCPASNHVSRVLSVSFAEAGDKPGGRRGRVGGGRGSWRICNDCRAWCQAPRAGCLPEVRGKLHRGFELGQLALSCKFCCAAGRGCHFCDFTSRNKIIYCCLLFSRTFSYPIGTSRAKDSRNAPIINADSRCWKGRGDTAMGRVPWCCPGRVRFEASTPRV